MTSLEADLIAHCQRAEMFRVGLALPTVANAGNTIPASLIRNVLLGLIGPTAKPAPVMLRGAVIDGLIDLRDCGGEGGTLLPPLVLFECVLQGDPARPMDNVLDGRHVRLSRLSLSHCRIGRVDLADAVFGGDLDLEALAPLDDVRPCQVTARRCRIEGTVIACRAHLRIARGQSVGPHDADDHALDLNSARISGSLELEPHFVAEGGVNLHSARIEGHIWASGSRISASRMSAFKAQSLQCAGNMALRARTHGGLPAEPCLVDGEVDLSFASFGGLDVRGIRIQSSRAGDGHAASDGHLSMTDSRVHGAVRIGDSYDAGQMVASMFVSGSVIVNGSTIDGDFTVFVDATTTWRNARIEAENLKVEGNVRIVEVCESLNLKLLQVGGELYVGTGHASKTEARRNTLRFLRLTDATVRSSVVLGGRVDVVDAGNLHVGGNLTCDLADSAINIELSRIGGALVIDAENVSSIDAKDVDVGGSVRISGGIRQWSSADTIRFDGGNYHGSFEIGDLAIRQYATKYFDSISIQDARIERELKIGKIQYRRDVPSEWVEHPLEVRAARATFFPGWLLVEVRCAMGGDEEGIVTYLIESAGNAEPVLIGGSAAPIHALRMRNALQLTDEGVVLDYLRFFCRNVRGEDGVFFIVEDQALITDATDDPALLAKVKPIAIEATETGWNCTAVLVYAGFLFESRMSVLRDGEINMTEDTPLGELKKPLPYRLVPSVRFIAKTPADAPTAASQLTVAAADESPSEAAGSPSAAPFPRFWIPLIFAKPETVEVTAPEAIRSLRKLWAGIGEAASRTDATEGPVDARAFTCISLQGLNVASLRHDPSCVDIDPGILFRLDGLEYERVEPVKTSEIRSAFQATRDASQVADPSPTAGRRIASWFRRMPQRVSRSGRRRWRRTLDLMSGKPGLSDEADMHVRWLSRQYPNGVPSSVEEFEPQPYEQLARVLRNHGHDDVAKEIALAQLCMARRLNQRRSKRMGLWWLETFFSYGLFSFRASVTFLVLWFAGTVFFDYANYGVFRIPFGSRTTYSLPWLQRDTDREPLLVVDSLAVSTLLPSGAGPAMSRPIDTTDVSTEQRCGDQVESAIYALDVMVPLLDLKQEEKCSISSRDEAWPWRGLKAVYAVIGAIVTSLLLLTISGVLKRRTEQ